MNDKTFIARGLLAGICISLGGVIYLRVGGAAGACLFAFGLIAVVTLKLNLFTGKAQFVWTPSARDAWREGGYPWLLAILALNILGCIATGALMADDALREGAVAILDRRLESAPWRNGLLATGCGFIMTLAVRGVADGKWLPLLFGIPAFILCGLPHCVADAFYIALLPADYLQTHTADLLLFYAAIVAGNFLGCNAYRLVTPTPAPTTRTDARPVRP